MFFQILWGVVVFSCMLFLLYVVTKYIGTKVGKVMKGKIINIVETINLGMDKQIHLIKVGEQFILISSSGRNISFLTNVQMDGYEYNEKVDTSKNAFDFKAFFEKYLQNIKGKKDTKVEEETNNVENIVNLSEGEAFKTNLNRLRTITKSANRQGKKDGDEGLR